MNTAVMHQQDQVQALHAFNLPDQPAERSQFFSSFGWAALLETVVVCILFLLWHASPPRMNQDIVPISIESLREEIAPPAPPAKITPPPLAEVHKIVAAAKIATPPPPLPRQAEPLPVVAPSQETQVAMEKPPSLTAPTGFSAAPTPPVSLVEPKLPQGPSAQYVAQVKAAVQSAAVYPTAARALNFKGKARVEFSLRDAVASHAKIITSSGLGMVDRAALRSIESATFPTPPASSSGRDDVFQVWIDFM